jgi:hypothetical protein
MSTRFVIRPYWSYAVPALVFLACWLVTLTNVFRQHPERLTLAIMGDLLLTAPLAYWLLSSKPKPSLYSLFKIALLGLLVATFLLTGQNRDMVMHWRKLIAPVTEIAVVGFVVWKFIQARRNPTNEPNTTDFLATSRQVLTGIFGNEKIGAVVSSEVAVFHYLLNWKRPKPADHITTFTTYKQSGVIIVLYAFLGIFAIETMGMHFLLSAWKKPVAWVVTILSAYSCLQLLGHIRAQKARKTVLSEDALIVRHGLLGGDAIIPYALITEIKAAGKSVPKEKFLKVALLRSMEKQTISVKTSTPITVIRAFGIHTDSNHLLLCVDDPNIFLERVTEKMDRPKI